MGREKVQAISNYIGLHVNEIFVGLLIAVPLAIVFAVVTGFFFRDITSELAASSLD